MIMISLRLFSATASFKAIPLKIAIQLAQLERQICFGFNVFRTRFYYISSNLCYRPLPDSFVSYAVVKA